MNLTIPKRLRPTSTTPEEEVAKEAAKLAIAVINSELVTLSHSLAPYLHAKARLEKRIEHLARRKHRLQRLLVGVTKCPSKVGPYSVPELPAIPSKESFIKKVKSFSKQRLLEFGLHFGPLGPGTGEGE